MASLACAETEGIQFIAQTNAASRFLTRLNQVTDRLCDINRRVTTAEFRLRQYCDGEPTTSTSSSSSSSECFPACCDCSEVVENLYKLSEEDATDPEILSLLDDLEAETCELYRQLKSFELTVGVDCTISSSSSSESASSSSSTSSSESSSTSSSESSSASSSVSSSSSQICCKDTITIFSECPDLGLDPPIVLFGRASAIPGGGACEYVEESVLNASSSSSDSSTSSSASFSSSALTGFSMFYEIATDTWQIFNNGLLVASIGGMNECEPYGSYTVSGGVCDGELIIVE